MEFLKSFGKITAAAVTGPERQPLPASSVPHSMEKFEKLNFSIYINLKNKSLLLIVILSFINKIQ